MAAPALKVPARAAAPRARDVTSRCCARRAAMPRPATFGNVTRSSRRAVRPAAAVGPNEVNELAASTLLTLSSLETVLGKVSFGSLLTATSIYEYKVRHQTLVHPNAAPEITRHAKGRYPNPPCETRSGLTVDHLSTAIVLPLRDRSAVARDATGVLHG